MVYLRGNVLAMILATSTCREFRLRIRETHRSCGIHALAMTVQDLTPKTFLFQAGLLKLDESDHRCSR
jgi:hypothetical protein